jgi:CheY-like chemotaxis protein
MRRTLVLLADDDDELRALLAAFLSLDGCEVVEVNDGSSLLEYMRRARDNPEVQTPDLIISDICMPERTGLEAVQTLRFTDVTTPVVLMTAFAEPTTYAGVRDLGRTVVMSKPIDIEDLRTVVDAMVEAG